MERVYSVGWKSSLGNQPRLRGRPVLGVFSMSNLVEQGQRPHAGQHHGAVPTVLKRGKLGNNHLGDEEDVFSGEDFRGPESEQGEGQRVPSYRMNPVTLFRMEVTMVIFWNSIYVKDKELWVCVESCVYTYKCPRSCPLRGTRSIPTSRILTFGYHFQDSGLLRENGLL